MLGSYLRRERTILEFGVMNDRFKKQNTALTSLVKSSLWQLSDYDLAFHQVTETVAMISANRKATPDAHETVCEYRVRRPDGSLRWMFERGDIEFNAEGEQIRRIGMVMDITERRLAEETLRESVAVAKFATHLTQLGGWSVNLGAGETTWTEETSRIYEAGPGYVPTVEGGIACFAPEYRQLISEAFDRCISDGDPFDLELGLITLKNNRRWVRVMGEQVKDADGTVTGARGAIQNITDQVDAKEALRRSEERYALATAAAQAALWDWDVSSGDIIFSEQYRELVGYSYADFLDRVESFKSILHPEDQEVLTDVIGKYFRSPHSGAVTCEYRLKRSDGEYYWFRSVAQALWNDEGKAIRLVGTTVDITDIRNAQIVREELLERERAARREADNASKYYRSLFEYAPGSYLVLTPDEFEIVAVSDSYLVATMTTREELQGQKFFEVFPNDPDDPAADGETNLRASFGRVNSLNRSDVMPIQRHPVRDRDGRFIEKFWGPVNTPVPGPNGEIAFIIHRAEDVTA
ncbi:MAG: PAS domain-containing protein [Blastocatellia bacterium]|nr:PAS domain-containing protein [Blastocatellia bacterium]